MISIGFHWAILQSVAWAGMLVRYSMTSSSIGDAVTMTFDGRHPCRLCEVARTVHKAETRETTIPRISKLDLFTETSSVEVDLILWRPEPVLASDVYLVGRTTPPPTPPPRWS